MEEALMETRELIKRYNAVNVLDRVSITIEQGKIYGFIGKNGAGKTTLIRLLTGLIKPTEGTIRWNGVSTEKALRNGREKTGTVIEHAGLYPNLSARQNLEMHRKMKGIKDKACVDIALAKVGLTKTKRKKFKDFSMGMKGRLGIAAALLGSPNFLILDEPINGLEPIGIIEIRNCLLNLNRKAGMTILISSHILGELYSLATDYIINNGKILKQISQEQLKEKCQAYITVIPKEEQTEQTKAILKFLGIEDYTIEKSNIFKILSNRVDNQMLIEALFEQKICIKELSYQEESLEAYFTSLIGERTIIS